MKAQQKRIYLMTGGALLIGLGMGWLFFGGGGSSSEENTAVSATENQAVEAWTCSMHPQIRQSEPGQCPICGMDLIPAVSETSEADPMAVKMSEAAMKLANVQTTVVGFGNDSRVVRLNGKVQENEKLQRSQAAHVAGRIEELMVDFTGEFIQEGQPLATIYSPELVTAQKELIIAAKARDEQPDLYASAREKLKNWKLGDEQITEIAESGEVQGRVPVLANTSGYVLQKKVQRGDYVKKGQILYEVVDLSSVWLMFDVYESDLEWVDKGDEVQVTVAAFPGRSWTGTVDYIDPVIDDRTRVAKARVQLRNPGGLLKPEMFATGVVTSDVDQTDQLTVPKIAVMWTGKRSVVYVKSQDANGVYFRMREVELGPEVGDSYVIANGLNKGEEIATHGTFSIDAAAQLAGKPSMMSPEGGPAPTGHQHVEDASGNHTERQMDKSTQAGKPDSPAELKNLIEDYLHIRSALTQSDFEMAQQALVQFQRDLQSIDMGAFTGQGHSAWMKYQPELASHAADAGKAKDLAAFRASFKPFSQTMIDLVMKFNNYEQTLYVKYCPMADNNSGAYWLSDKQEIQNPYFGEAMLTCGSIKNQL